MSLLDRLKTEIAAGGPIGVDAYMTRCLHDPKDGYYATRPALGEDGDFITAPMVSQMFGELIGLWAVETWRRMGAPPRVLLVEIGPGDGTLMSDALRAARLAPDFLAAAALWLIETSKPLVERQQARLADASPAPKWTASLAALPDDAPLILIANEVFDCLPVRQLVRTRTGWAERRIGLGDDGALVFGLAPPVEGAASDAAVGAVLEIAETQGRFAGEIAGRIVGQGGAALIVDYGRTASCFGDTLQALRRHEKVDPLATPGEADLTVHVDFPAILANSRDRGAACPALTQGEFLLRLGVMQRAEALVAARPEQAGRIDRQLERLIGGGEMGVLFKAACIHDPAFAPPAFEDAPWPT
ncbi:MAG TPA: SAM-dependent methyltransferase [Caulobacteraceae bacterium]|nr:SAM-dependent methyltransferase [Caulobacteraceae bacterium]